MNYSMSIAPYHLYFLKVLGILFDTAIMSFILFDFPSKLFVVGLVLTWEILSIGSRRAATIANLHKFTKGAK
jgi:hypothetical protein